MKNCKRNLTNSMNENDKFERKAENKLDKKLDNNLSKNLINLYKISTISKSEIRFIYKQFLNELNN